MTLHLKKRTLDPSPNKDQVGESHTIVGALRCSAIPLHTLLFNLSSGCLLPSFLYFCTVLPSTAHYPMAGSQQITPPDKMFKTTQWTTDFNRKSDTQLGKNSSITSKDKNFVILITVGVWHFTNRHECIISRCWRKHLSSCGFPMVVCLLSIMPLTPKHVA
jgi:hypothetical protein